jgi:hypothetical protein
MNVVQKCIEYLTLLIEFSLKVLKNFSSPPEEIFHVMIRIFGGDKNARKFFERFGISATEQNERTDGAFAVLPV